MTFGRIVRSAGWSILSALVIVTATPASAVAQDEHAHAAAPRDVAPEQKERMSALVKVVREATERYKDVRIAEGDGYALQFGCVTGSESGAMGMHYVNMPLVLDGEIDASRPEIVIYEPQPNGRARLIGADYIVLAEQWNKKHPDATPQLMGQLFHYFESPNRFGLPPFYTLHVWAWKPNPTGTFTNWHSNVSCDAYGGGTR